MEYSERTYRSRFRGDRWAGFVVKVKESDLWVGVDRASYRPDMKRFCEQTLGSIRSEMEEYLASDAEYASSLAPRLPREGAPQVMVRMAEAAEIAGVGPMAAVAGAVAEAVGQTLRRQFDVREVLVENGGDIYADIAGDIDVSVFAGQSPLSEKVGLRIPAGVFGVCTSSGTVGHSLSLGRADAVMVVCRDALLADAWATSLANRVHTIADLDAVAEQIGAAQGILGALLVKDDRMAVIGEFELKIFG